MKLILYNSKNLRIKCMTETKNVSVLFYKNLKSSFLHSTWHTHLTQRFLYILGCSGPWCGIAARYSTFSYLINNIKKTKIKIQFIDSFYTNPIHQNKTEKSLKLEYFTTSKTDCQLLRQKVCQRISVMKTKYCFCCCCFQDKTWIKIYEDQFLML